MTPGGLPRAGGLLEQGPGGSEATGRRVVSHPSDVAEFPTRRVLVVAPQPFYEDRGTPIAVRQVLQALGELGYPVDLVTFPVGRDVPIPGLRIFRSANPLRFNNVPIGLSWRKLVLDVPLVSLLRSRLERDQYWCIHAVEEAAFPAAILARRHGIPLLYDMQSSLAEQLVRLRPFGLPPVRWTLEAIERWLLRRSSMVVTSAGLAARVARSLPTVPVREWHFPSAPTESSAADIQRLRDGLGLTGTGPVVLYSGSFEAYQGLRELIAAIPAVRQRVPEATFVLVGADRANGLVAHAEADSLMASGALRIVERQPREMMAAYLALADVLVSPRAYGGNLPLEGIRLPRGGPADRRHRHSDASHGADGGSRRSRPSRDRRHRPGILRCSGGPARLAARRAPRPSGTPGRIWAGPASWIPSKPSMPRSSRTCQCQPRLDRTVSVIIPAPDGAGRSLT